MEGFFYKEGMTFLVDKPEQRFNLINLHVNTWRHRNLVYISGVFAIL
jgi:hypothetical protein